MNEQIIKAIADSVAETLLTERDRTEARLAKLSEQIDGAKADFIAAIEAIPVAAGKERDEAIAKARADFEEALKQVSKSATEAAEAAISVERQRTDASFTALQEQIESAKAVFDAAVAVIPTTIANERNVAIAEAVANLEDALNQVSKNAAEAVAALKGTVEEQANWVSAQRDNLAEQIRKEIDKQSEQFGEKLEDVKSSFVDSIISRFALYAERAQLGEAELNLLERIEALGTAVSEKQNSFEEQLKKTLMLPVAVNSAAKDIAALTERVGEIIDNIGNLSMKSEVQSALAELRDALSISAQEHHDNLQELNTLLGNVEARAEQKLAEVAASIPPLEPLAERIGEVAAAVSVLSESTGQDSQRFCAQIEELRKSFAEIGQTHAQIQKSFEDKRDIDFATFNSLRKEIEAVAEMQRHIVTIKGDKGDEGEPGVGILTKQWAPGVYREGSIVTYDIGRYAKAVRDTAAEPGKSDDWERIGTAGFAWTGLKKEGRAYTVGDMFIDEGTAFLWDGERANMFSKRGDKGLKGDKGDKGDKGTEAPKIVHGQMTATGLDIVLDDGSVVNAPIHGLKEFIAEQVRNAVLEVLSGK